MTLQKPCAWHARRSRSDELTWSMLSRFVFAFSFSFDACSASENHRTSLTLRLTRVTSYDNSMTSRTPELSESATDSSRKLFGLLTHVHTPADPTLQTSFSAENRYLLSWTRSYSTKEPLMQPWRKNPGCQVSRQRVGNALGVRYREYL